jgi:hypothetical protein
MTAATKLIFVLLSLVAVVHLCQYNPNKKPLIMDHPTLINKTTNGEKLIIGNLDDTQQNYIYIARVRGTPF